LHDLAAGKPHASPRTELKAVRPHNRLPRWHRRSIHALSAVLLLSGLAWLVLVYLLAPPGQETPAPHAFAGAALAIHGIAAQAALVVFALVGHAHLRAGWRTRAQRVNGAGVGMSMLLLLLTGLGFYYSASEAALPWLRWSHVAIGCLLPALVAWHATRARWLRRAG
jgi:hypothetical protein